MYGDYQSACEAVVTKAQARREVEKHGLTWVEFVIDVGDRETYQGREVLDWLGY